LGCHVASTTALRRLCAATSAIGLPLIVGRIWPFVGSTRERCRTFFTFRAKWRVPMPERAESVTAPERRAKGRSRWRWIVAAALVGGGAAFIWQRYALAQSKAQAPRGPPPLAVTTATATQGDIGVHLDALGTVTPLATVTVKSRVDGQLMAVNYREGQMVHQGDVLAEIDPRPFQVQLTQAEGQYQRDVALLENARIDLDRYQKLYARDAIPKQTLDTQVALVHQDEGVLKNDRGLIDNAKLQLVYSRITSPISGRVGLRLVDPGNIVHATDTGGLLMITQLQPITVVFSIAEDFLPQIQLGHRLAVDALDRAQQKRIATGEVLTFDNQIDTTTGTVKLKAVFPNQDDALFPNQFVNARLLVDVHRGATLVPSAAVQRSAQGAFLYLVKSDQTVSVQAVSLGATDGNAVEILKGLKPGDVIAIDNFDKLQDGIRISPRTAVAEGTGRSMR
jgi:membrane fusion protein, multidrug efflux system